MGLLDGLRAMVEPQPVTVQRASAEYDGLVEALYDIIEARQTSFTLQQALKLPPVIRGVELIAGVGASMLPLVYRDGQALDTQPRIVLKPDPFQSRYTFLWQTLYALVATRYGEAFWRLTDDGRAATVLANDEVRVQWDEGRLRPRYWWRDLELVPDIEIKHIAPTRPAGELHGKGPLHEALDYLYPIHEAEQYASSFFSSGGLPLTVLKTAAKLTAEQAAELKTQWVESREDAGGAPAVASGGVDVEFPGTDPQKSQMVEARSAGNAVVANVLGIPGALLNVTTSGATITYTNPASALEELVKSTLAPLYLAPIEQAWSELVPTGQAVRFDLADMQRADIAARFALYEQGVRTGFMEPTEPRRWEGWGPMETDSSHAFDAAPVARSAPEDELITRASADSVSPGDGRRLDIRLVAFGDVARRTNEGYPEQLLPGVFAGVDPARVMLESQKHGGAIVGNGEALVEREDGLYGTFRVAETTAGDELLALTKAGPNGERPVLTDASVVFAPQQQRVKDGVVQRIKAELRRVAIVERGAYASGQVLAVRSDPEMTEDTTQETPKQEETPALVERAEPDLTPITSRMDDMDERLTKLATIATAPGRGSDHELGQYATLGDYQAAVWAGQADAGLLARSLEDPLVARAAADQITTNNAGVVPPAWLTDVKRIVDLGRRAITAFGGPAPLPGTGMEVDWPYLNSSNTVIGAQSTEKTEVTSARVDIAKGSVAVETWAGYSDISYQLLQRSSPSYRDAYDRIMLAEWGKVTDAAFCADLEGATGTTTQAARGMLGSDVTLQTSAAADDIIDASTHGLSIGDAVVFTALTGGTGLTAGQVYWVIAANFTADDFQVSATPGGSAVDFTADITAGTVAKITDTGVRLHEALAQASVSVEDATGAPASIVLAGTDMFLAMAGLTGITQYGPSNAQGSMLASTLQVIASGLVIRRAPGVSNGKLIVSNPQAATWHEDGPRFIAAEDVAKLGQNVGVYSFNAPAVFVPAGIVELTLI
jgi:HK97 family phage portal protein